MDRGEDYTREASMAKLKAGRLVREVADTCMQFHGGMGYMEEYPMARYFRDSRLMSIGAGADEIMLGIIAKFEGIAPPRSLNGQVERRRGDRSKQHISLERFLTQANRRSPAVRRPILPSRLNPKSEQFQHNRRAVLEQLQALDELLAAARAARRRKEHRPASPARQAAGSRADRVLARSRSPFLELSPVAAAGTEYEVGASIAAGIGVVSGVECYISGNDPDRARRRGQSVHHAKVDARLRHLPAQSPAATSV